MSTFFDALARFVVIFNGMGAALLAPIFAVILLTGMIWWVARGPKELR